MKNKILIIAFLLMASVSASAVDYFDIDNLRYFVRQGTKTVVVTYAGTKPEGDLIIPAEVEYKGEKYDVVEIGTEGFEHCSDLSSVTIPNSVTYIGNDAFFDCSNLTDINVESANSKYSSENGVLFNKDKTTIICYPAGKTDTIYTIPNTVTSIGDEAFGECDKLTTVIISNSVTSIGREAFRECTGLTSIIIPNSITSIGDAAFFFCSGLTTITISNSVTSIGSEAFVACSSLTSITIPNSVTSMGSCVFVDCNPTIYCEMESIPEGWDESWNNGIEVNFVNNPTLITETAANAVNIYAYGRSIVVENAAEEISVYDAMGRLVCRDAINRVRAEIRVSNPDLYIVKVGNVAKRMMVK